MEDAVPIKWRMQVGLCNQEKYLEMGQELFMFLNEAPVATGLGIRDTSTFGQWL